MTRRDTERERDSMDRHRDRAQLPVPSPGGRFTCVAPRSMIAITWTATRFSR